ncbi:MAG: fatty acid desaturase [Myxococcales bacterium]|nr:fatty acid desaturase [Myxococcales bacterium]
MMQCAAVAACGLLLFLISDPLIWLFAPVYWAVWAFGVLDRFILMLHCTSHRILFNKDNRWMNQLIPWVLGPFFGETPETYFAHHMGMHHPENNLADDLSSTMKYRRDSFRGWLVYYFEFLVLTVPRLASYHWNKKNPRMMRRLLVGELGFYAFAAALAFVNWRATLIVFVIPVIAVRTLMMAGNWGQHAFIDASDPADAFKNSITCINSRYNRRAFNDGYHIFHHVKARAHWTELPFEFRDNIAMYAEKDAVVFAGIDFFMVWAYLMLGRWPALARSFVRLPGAPERSDDEVIAMLKARVLPILS